MRMSASWICLVIVVGWLCAIEQGVTAQETSSVTVTPASTATWSECQHGAVPCSLRAAVENGTKYCAAITASLAAGEYAAANACELQAQGGNLTLIGDGTVVWNCAGFQGFFRVVVDNPSHGLAISNIYFVGAKGWTPSASPMGCVHIVTNGQVTVESCSFLDMTSTALLIQGRNVVVFDCVFLQNEAVDQSAGLIALLNSTTLIVSNCYFTQNEVLVTQNSGVIVSADLFIGNSADAADTTSHVTVTNSTFGVKNFDTTRIYAVVRRCTLSSIGVSGFTGVFKVEGSNFLPSMIPYKAVVSQGYILDDMCALTYISVVSDVVSVNLEVQVVDSDFLLNTSMIVNDYGQYTTLSYRPSGALTVLMDGGSVISARVVDCLFYSNLQVSDITPFNVASAKCIYGFDSCFYNAQFYTIMSMASVVSTAPSLHISNCVFDGLYSMILGTAGAEKDVLNLQVEDSVFGAIVVPYGKTAMLINDCATTVSRCEFTGNMYAASLLTLYWSVQRTVQTVVTSTEFNTNLSVDNGAEIFLYWPLSGQRRPAIGFENCVFHRILSITNNRAVIQVLGGLDVDFVGCNVTDNVNKDQILGTITVEGPATVDNARVNFRDCLFARNTARKGGAIYLLSAVSANITNTRFENNTGSFGGSLYLEGVLGVKIVDSNVTVGTASQGGFIYAKDTSIRIVGGLFQNLTAAYGGVIFLRGASLTAIGAVFNAELIDSENLPKFFAGSGGAIYADDISSISLDTCQFNLWVAVSAGGVVALRNIASLSARSTSFYQGNSANNGGAIAAQDSATVTLDNCKFIACRAVAGSGGAIYLADSAYLSAVGTEFIRNAAGNGGAVSLQDVSAAELNFTVAKRNNAVNGGVIFIDNNSHLTIRNASFEDNQAVGSGGAIACTGGIQALIINSTFVNNAAKVDGGALSVKVEATPDTDFGNQIGVELRAVTLSMNRAQRGGAIFTSSFTTSGPHVGFNGTKITVTGNTAECIVQPWANISGCLSADQHAGGGGVYFGAIAYTPKQMKDADITFSDNTAPYGNDYATGVYRLAVTEHTPQYYSGQTLRLSVVAVDTYGTPMHSLNGWKLDLGSKCLEQQYTLSTSGVFNISGVLRGKPGTTCTLTLTSDKQQVAAPGADLKLRVNIELGSCSRGFGFDGSVCSVCADGTYAFASTHHNPTCQRCPSMMTCISGIASPVRGYWMHNTVDGRVESFACPPGNCEGKNRTTEMCSQHRNSSSPLCGACDDGYSAWNGHCIECTHGHGWVIFGTLLILWAYVIFQLVVLQWGLGAFSILFFNAQTSALLIYPQSRLYVLNVLSNSGSQSLFTACLFPRSSYGELATSVVIPLLLFALLAFTAVAHSLLMLCCRRGDDSRLTKLYTRKAYMQAVIGLGVGVYQPLLEAALHFLACRSVAGHYVNAWLPDIRCYDRAYFAWAALYVPLLAVVVAWPVVMWLWLKRYSTHRPALSEPLLRRDTVSEAITVPAGPLDEGDGVGNGSDLEDAAAAAAARGHKIGLVKSSAVDWRLMLYTMLSGSYQPEYYAWEVYSMLRRALLLTTMTVMNVCGFTPFVVNLVQGFWLLCYFAIHTQTTPFKMELHNRLELFSLFELHVVSMLVSSAQYSSTDDAAHSLAELERWYVFNSAVVTLSASGILAVLVWLFFMKWRARRSQQRKTADDGQAAT